MGTAGNRARELAVGEEENMAEEVETNATPQAESAPAAESAAVVTSEAAVQAPTPEAAPVVVAAPTPAAEPSLQEMLAAAKAKADAAPVRPEARPAGSDRPPRDSNRGQGNRPPREGQNRPPRPDGAPSNREGQAGNRPPRDARAAGAAGGGARPERGSGDRPAQHGPAADRGGDRGRFGDRRPDFNADIELEKLIADSLYLDNQAHAVAARMQDMDSATKSHLRRFYNAVRRACRTVETERQHEFVMLRARLAYTIARHSLRSLDSLEKLLLQVTRKNDAKGYERFKDLFEAIIAYNE